MNLDSAIELLKHVVKYTGTIDSKHIDLNLVPNNERSKYQKALVIAQMAIQKGEISRDDFLHRIHVS